MSVAKYDPASVVIIIGVPVTGFAAGSFAEGGRNEDTWKLVVGADGLVTRVRNRNASGRLKLTLMQTSPSNAVLSALAVLDEATGEGVVPVLVKDLNGTELLTAANGWVVKPPEHKFGADLTDREWVIEMDETFMLA